MTRSFLILLSSFAVLSTSACLRDTRPSRERTTGSFWDTAPVVKGPEANRCEAHAGKVSESHCADARYLAELWARRLSVTDEVCLDNGVGDEPGPACQARASVVDVATGRLLLEIREAQPGTDYFDRIQSQVWFEETALVDLYLAERGY